MILYIIRHAIAAQAGTNGSAEDDSQRPLTDEGRKLCRKIPFGLSRVLNSMLRGFTPAELDTFKTLTRRMLANAERH